MKCTKHKNDVQHQKRMPNDQWKNISLLFWYIISNEMHTKNAKGFGLSLAHGSLPLSKFSWSNIFFLFWTLKNSNTIVITVILI